MRSILVLGDGEAAEQVARELTGAGYGVEVRPFAEALESTIAAESDAIVAFTATPADLGPLTNATGSGIDKSPVLAVLSESALEAGPCDFVADDFAMLPLRPREVETRLRRLLDQHALLESPDVLRRGALAIDRRSYKVFVDGVPAELTFKEYELLFFLAMHPDRVYTREALLDKVWGYDYFGGARTVDVHIRRIRSKIERNHVFIETVRSVGYRFRASA